MTREEAIEILRDTPIDIRSTREDDIYSLYATAQNMAIEALTEPKWIPVTERLPKAEYGESKPVLVTECWKYDNGTSFAIRTAEYDGGAWHDGTGNVFTETKVIAWMPLPEPYEGSDTE